MHEWVNWADFLHVDANSGKLRITYKKYINYKYMVSGMLKVTLGMCMVKYDCGLLGPETLKSALSQLKIKLMNSADFLHAGSEVIIFGWTINHALYL